MTHLPMLLAACAMLLAAAPARALEEACRVPPELVKSKVRLEQVEAVLKARQPVKIVVLGTGSSAGAGVSGAPAAYPARLEHWLGESWGRARVTVINFSQQGQTAVQMVARMPAIIREHRPTLIIWQTGTVDAMKAVDVNQFGEAIERGIRIADDAHVDLILMNAQFGSQAFTLRDVSPYLDYLDQIVRGRDVILFRRYAVMRYWVESGALNLGEVPKDEQKKVADRVHDCIAQLLAEMIRTGAE